MARGTLLAGETDLHMVPAYSDIGLKEWSATIEALGSGDQIILLRKGGIREDARRFSVAHDQFFLYPTHYHQGADMLKPDARHLLQADAGEPDDPIVELGVFAEIVDTIELEDERSLRQLDAFHVWTADYMEKRLRWKPRQPLTVLILRCHLLQQPQALPLMDEYRGCTSWVQFIEEYPVGVTTPALNDRRFDAQTAKIRKALSP